MIKSKMTPGPWKTEKHNDDYIEIYHNSILIADVLNTYNQTSKANATAIAALPDIIDNLKWLILAAEIIDSQHPPDTNDVNFLHKQIDKARKTLKQIGAIE